MRYKKPTLNKFFNRSEMICSDHGSSAGAGGFCEGGSLDTGQCSPTGTNAGVRDDACKNGETAFANWRACIGGENAQGFGDACSGGHYASNHKDSCWAGPGAPG